MNQESTMPTTPAFVRMRTLTIGLGLATSALLSGGFSTPVEAVGKPDRFEYDVFERFLDTEVCAAAPWGFDVAATEHGYGFVEVFYDADGNFLRGINHLNLDFTISANGVTLNERDQVNVFYDANGRAERGLQVHIQGPRGIVTLDAGQLVFDAEDNLVYARGRHPQFFGETFCDALVP